MREGDGSVLVAMCSRCETYLDMDQVGRPCPCAYCGGILKKRRGFVCTDCEEQPIFWGKKPLKEHQVLEHPWQDSARKE